MRNLSPDIFKDEFFASQSHRLRLLWIGLIVAMADDQGRLEERPLYIKLAIFPFDSKITIKDIETDLKVLAKHKKIVRYTADGKRLIQIVNWWKYQAGAQWASRSLFKAPPRWTDRIRAHERGHGQSIVTENWDRSGGFNSKPLPKPLPSRKVADSKPIASREDEEEEEDNDKQASKGAQKSKESAAATMPAAAPALENANATTATTATTECQLSPDQITWIRATLSALGVKNGRLEQTIAKLATRNYNGNLKKHVLGNIASVYADKRKVNKPVIVAMRLENHEEPLPEFVKPESWTVVPKNVLEAAGIHDLAEMFTRPELKPYAPPPDENYVPMPEEVREKLANLVKAKTKRH